ncbi:MAG: SAP domain-containing protein [Verrucomicrobiaceae bacterium]|nr:SAP domain-containing protein [Verrucomicrobiaceae bacterium]
MLAACSNCNALNTVSDGDLNLARCEACGHEFAAVEFDWCSCPGHMRLLSEFDCPKSVSALDARIQWEQELGEPLSEAIARFDLCTLLQAPRLEDAICMTYGGDSLKDLCRERGIKSSGSKAEAAKRLSEHSSEELSTLIGLTNWRVCSDAGRVWLERWAAKGVEREKAVARRLSAEDLFAMREKGFSFVKLLGSGSTERTCAAALHIEQQPILISEAEPLPLSGCSLRHCACVYCAEIDSIDV